MSPNVKKGFGITIYKNGKPVCTKGGTVLVVFSDEEEKYLKKLISDCYKEYSFENPIDIANLDLLIGLQLLSFRYLFWATKGVDYMGNPIDIKEVRLQLKDLGQEMRSHQNQLGIARKDRQERATVYSIIENIKEKAKEYGIHIEESTRKFFLAYHRIADLIGTYSRMNEEERKKFSMTPEQIILKISEILADVREYEEQYRESKGKLYASIIRGDFE